MAHGFGQDPIPGMGRLTPDNAILRVCNGPCRQRQFALNQPRCVLGRSDLPHLVVDLDLSECELGETAMISRRHALLQWVRGELQVIDLASRNGTFVDGQPLKSATPQEPSAPITLQVGSQLRLGNLELEVSISG